MQQFSECRVLGFARNGSETAEDASSNSSGLSSDLLSSLLSSVTGSVRSFLAIPFAPRKQQQMSLQLST
eukprot:2383603-Amphidinium_carterae.1